MIWGEIPLPQKVEKLPKAMRLLGKPKEGLQAEKPQMEQFRNASAAHAESELQDYCEDYYCRGTTKPWQFIVSSTRLTSCSADQLNPYCVHARKKGGKKNVSSIKGKNAAFEDTGSINNYYAKSEIKFSSLA